MSRPQLHIRFTEEVIEKIDERVKNDGILHRMEPMAERPIGKKSGRPEWIRRLVHRVLGFPECYPDGATGGPPLTLGLNQSTDLTGKTIVNELPPAPIDVNRSIYELCENLKGPTGKVPWKDLRHHLANNTNIYMTTTQIRGRYLRFKKKLEKKNGKN